MHQGFLPVWVFREIQRCCRPFSLTPGGLPASPFTWRTTDGSSTRSRWPDMSLREQPNSTTAQRTRLHSLHSVRSSGSGCDVRFLSCSHAIWSRGPSYSQRMWSRNEQYYRYMKLRALILGLGFVACILSSRFVYAEPLQGNVGVSPQWKSGWLDLDPPVDFRSGDIIRLKIGGTAERIIVRFLTVGESPGDPVGIEGGALPVQGADRTVDLTLKGDHPQTKQISVHGGSNPWGLYPLGENNGPATIL